MTMARRRGLVFAKLLILISLQIYQCREDTSASATLGTVVVTAYHIRNDNRDIVAFEEELQVEALFSNRVPDGCSLVMTHSTIPHAGWGVFSLIKRIRNEPLLSYEGESVGDVVVQIPDMIFTAGAMGAKKLLWEYLWDGQETGGQYEGQKVASFVPGPGMLANGDVAEYNILPSLQPCVDDSGVSRQSLSPGVGAITHYHNFTWFVSRDMAPGDEVFVNYGASWFQERGFPFLVSSHQRKRPKISDLRREGYCLDNLRPGISSIPHAGRGAFATRALGEGSVVAPYPVLPVSTKALKSVKQHENGTWVESEQLLRNYCFGHSQSTILLCPYSDMVNLINHATSSSHNHTDVTSFNAITATANVRLRWSKRHGPQYFDLPIEMLQESSTQLLLELIALRDIDAGEELLLDYGFEWVNAWNNRLDDHKSFRNGSNDYIPAFSLNQDHTFIVKTMKEQLDSPYPSNIFTSCFFRFTNKESQHMQGSVQRNRKPKRMVTDWKHTKGVYDPSNLRPCWVLDRHPSGEQDWDDTAFTYAIRLMNRPGLSESDRIPDGVHYIVANVPRRAIQFSDKLYTTDQHLENSFRQSIAMPLGVFPTQWMDLLQKFRKTHLES